MRISEDTESLMNTERKCPLITFCFGSRWHRSPRESGEADNCVSCKEIRASCGEVSGNFTVSEFYVRGADTSGLFSRSVG